jgi:hypothetical protein
MNTTTLPAIVGKMTWCMHDVASDRPLAMLIPLGTEWRKTIEQVLKFRSCSIKYIDNCKLNFLKSTTLIIYMIPHSDLV